MFTCSSSFSLTEGVHSDSSVSLVWRPLVRRVCTLRRLSGVPCAVWRPLVRRVRTLRRLRLHPPWRACLHLAAVGAACLHGTAAQVTFAVARLLSPRGCVSYLMCRRAAFCGWPAGQ